MKEERKLLYLLLFVALFVVGFRFLLRLHFLVVTALIIAGVGFLGYFIWSYLRNIQAKKAFARSPEGVIEGRIIYCEKQIESNEKEITEIWKNVTDLKKQIGASSEITSENRTESENLIKAFQSEIGLRQAKIKFFSSCIQKLKTLLKNLRFVQSLESKKEQLKQLRENHYEDLADMENLKMDLEWDESYLSNIETLTLKMSGSTSLDDAQRLQVELEEMTREL